MNAEPDIRSALDLRWWRPPGLIVTIGNALRAEGVAIEIEKRPLE
jgi:hypothetical protein